VQAPSTAASHPSTSTPFSNFWTRKCQPPVVCHFFTPILSIISEQQTSATSAWIARTPSCRRYRYFLMKTARRFYDKPSRARGITIAIISVLVGDARLFVRHLAPSGRCRTPSALTKSSGPAEKRAIRSRALRATVAAFTTMVHTISVLFFIAVADDYGMRYAQRSARGDWRHGRARARSGRSNSSIASVRNP